jgi:hypothetical protein
MRSLVSFGMEVQKFLVSDSSVSLGGMYGCQLPETTASINELSTIPRGFPSLATKISSGSKACLLVPKSDLKTARGASPSWVRIPPLPPDSIVIIGFSPVSRHRPPPRPRNGRRRVLRARPVEYSPPPRPARGRPRLRRRCCPIEAWSVPPRSCAVALPRLSLSLPQER